MKNIRNFCIIAHIDHGKSTLADRLLEMTETVEKRKISEQMMDTMELEQERGITIKLQPATMKYGEYTLNLIDTPGHVDFGYEVSRSLAAVEGAVLLVDCTQGVQAQTLANLYQAIDQDLEIIPVLNKIDLPNADIEKTKKEIVHILGCNPDDILCVSGKTGEGVEKLLEEIIEKVPVPEGRPEAPLRAMIFDSKYDSYKGVLAYVRIVDGAVKAEDDIRLMVGGRDAHIIEVGKFTPALEKLDLLSTGDIGYIATGLKSVDQCKVGDTISFQTSVKKEEVKTLPGYKDVRPMVYASFYPTDGEDYNQFRDALDKLKLNDAALVFEGESSMALGRGFRIGFLGLLHLEIIRERLLREFNFEPVITTPSVVYEIVLSNGEEKKIYAAAEMPEANAIKEIREPHVKLDIITPSQYLGNVMELVRNVTRAKYLSTEYIDETRLVLSFDAPLAEVIVNLHDGIQSATSGFASFSYEMTGYVPADLVRMDIYVAEEKIEAFSQIVPKENVNTEGNRIVKKLKDVIPRQNFLVKLQAAIGGKFVGRENITPYRKDVTGHLYGGDITRKRKLLEKQKRGKKRMKGAGKVDIPQKAFLEVLKR
ncbi:elongation factor 4 [bacterium]|jgi:GTP-binding protein LepA|nr:elongation factor 4 [bacterium]MBT4251316.1 elongation factor 4 [bacterium]MBT4598303.1 elongation factor 4 [bacterium]MBT6754136.1 elongation factor 4 [bacterium]MBT7037956.1 elongation factor 4 [bacterium]